MTKTSITLFLWAFFLLNFGCAGPRNLVVLVADPDGSVGSISVSNQAGSVLLDSQYQSTNIKDSKSAPTTPLVMKKKKVHSIFAEALAAQPEPPVHFLLYFKKGLTDLTADSLSKLPLIIKTIRTRNAFRISVVGHTDTIGDKDSNIRLSTQRAESVSRLLIQKGVKEEKIETTSHGEENQLVKTEDNVSEPKNRRVEVIVR